MLRVTHCCSDRDQTETFRVEGRLTRHDLPRLQEAYGELLGSPHRIRLELSGLQFADREAVAELQALRRRGVSLVGVSGFLDALLDEASR